MDAFDNPDAEADLAGYRTTYGLPPRTTANRCFTKINARGGTAPPQPDPDWGLEISVAVHDTFDFPGWLVAGGTSASAPIIAALYARAGDARQIRNASALYEKDNRRHLYDVTGGSNATSLQDCGGDYLCTGLPGSDAPTGVGTPRGITAFSSAGRDS